EPPGNQIPYTGTAGANASGKLLENAAAAPSAAKPQHVRQGADDHLTDLKGQKVRKDLPDNRSRNIAQRLEVDDRVHEAVVQGVELIDLELLYGVVAVFRIRLDVAAEALAGRVRVLVILLTLLGLAHFQISALPRRIGDIAGRDLLLQLAL